VRGETALWFFLRCSARLITAGRVPFWTVMRRIMLPRDTARLRGSRMEWGALGSWRDPASWRTWGSVPARGNSRNFASVVEMRRNRADAADPGLAVTLLFGFVRSCGRCSRRSRRGLTSRESRRGRFQAHVRSVARCWITRVCQSPAPGCAVRLGCGVTQTSMIGVPLRPRFLVGAWVCRKSPYVASVTHRTIRRFLAVK
jgi:hypothetical protein